MISKETNRESIVSSGLNSEGHAVPLIKLSHDLKLIRPTPQIMLARRIGSLLLHRNLELHEIEGTFGSENKKIRILAADDGRMLPYLRKGLRLSITNESRIGTISALQIPDLDNDYDIVLSVANRLFHRRFMSLGFYIIPAWIKCYVNLSTSSPEEYLLGMGSSAREDIRKVRSRDLSYEVTADPQWLSRFYEEMYLPYIKSRHRESAVIHSKKTIEGEFQNGGLLIVRESGVPILGLIIARYGEILQCSSMGTSGGNLDLTKKGRAASIYWFAMKWAHSIGCSIIDFGHARPFLSDGVLRYKLKWGMHVTDDDDPVCDITIKCMPGRPCGDDFIAQNPFYHL